MILFAMIPAKRVRSLCLLAASFVGFCVVAMRAEETSVPMRAKPVLEWQPLPSLPAAMDDGSYLGSAGGAFVIAGGGSGAAPGSTLFDCRNWSDAVHVLDGGEKIWREAGRLPRALGHGVSLPWKNGFVILGGRDATSCSAHVWLVTRLESNRLRFDPLPKMPKPLAGHAGAIIKNILYIAGGVSEVDAVGGTASDACYSLDLNNPTAGWNELPGIPGGGRFSVHAGAGGQSFFVFGGARIKPAPDGATKIEYLSDAWSYHPELGWKQLASLPVPLASSGASAVPVARRICW